MAYRGVYIFLYLLGASFLVVPNSLANEDVLNSAEKILVYKESSHKQIKPESSIENILSLISKAQDEAAYKELNSNRDLTAFEESYLTYYFSLPYVESYQKLVECSENAKPIDANRCSRLLSYFFLKTAEYDKASKYTELASNIILNGAEQFDSYAVLKTKDQIFMNHVYDFNTSRAETLAVEIVDLVTSQNLDYDVLGFITNLTRMYALNGRSKEAMFLTNRLIKYKHIWGGEDLAYLNYIVGEHYIKSDKFNEAKSYLDDAINLSKDPDLTVPARYMRLRSLIRLNQIDEVKTEWETLETLIKNDADLNDYLGHTRLLVKSELAYAVGEYEKAYKSYKDYADAELYSLRLKRAEEHTAYTKELSKTEAVMNARLENIRLEKEMIEKKLVIQWLLIILLAVGLVVFSILLKSAFSREKRIKRINAKLEKQNKETCEKLDDRTNTIHIISNEVNRTNKNDSEKTRALLENVSVVAASKNEAKKYEYINLVEALNSFIEKYKYHLIDKNIQIKFELGFPNEAQYIITSVPHINLIIENMINTLIEECSSGETIYIKLDKSGISHGGKEISIYTDNQNIYEFKTGLGQVVIDRCVSLLYGRFTKTNVGLTVELPALTWSGYREDDGLYKQSVA